MPELAKPLTCLACGTVNTDPNQVICLTCNPPTESEDLPRAWVGCLGCYNSGNLVGKWLAGTECADVVAAGLATLETVGDYTAPRCVKCFGDEFWVMDHDGYEGIISGECSPQQAQEAAELLESIDEDKRAAFAAWIGNGNALDSFDQFEEAYCGEWDSFKDFAENYIEDTGLLTVQDQFGHNIDIEHITRYFDYDLFARDLGFDYWTHETSGGVLVFNSNV